MKRNERFDVYDIPCSEIFYDEDFNCRGAFTLESVRELAESIRDDGLKLPIVVQPAADVRNMPPGYLYRLIAGHRRFKATTMHLRWEGIPAQVATGMNAKQAAKFNLLENLERNDLNFLEQARAIQKQFPYATDRECAAEVKRSTKWVTQRRILIRQPDEVQQMVASGRLSLAAVQDYIHPLRSKSAKISAARQLVDTNTVKEARREYRMLKRPRTRKEINDKIAYMLEMGLHDVAPILTRFAAWCGRGISDEEINADLADFLNHTPK